MVFLPSGYLSLRIVLYQCDVPIYLHSTHICIRIYSMLPRDQLKSTLNTSWCHPIIYYIIIMNVPLLQATHIYNVIMHSNLVIIIQNSTFTHSLTHSPIYSNSINNNNYTYGASFSPFVYTMWKYVNIQNRHHVKQFTLSKYVTR